MATHGDCEGILLTRREATSCHLICDSLLELYAGCSLTFAKVAERIWTAAPSHPRFAN
jgi:hypothetical protein